MAETPRTDFGAVDPPDEQPITPETESYTVQEVSTGAPKEPAYQALLPNLDRVSAASYAKGTVSRARINRALVVLALPVVLVAGGIVWALVSN